MPVHRCSCWMARSSWGLRRRPSVTAWCVVTAPFETSVARIVARDGISAEMAARRLNAQTPESTPHRAGRLCAAQRFQPCTSAGCGRAALHKASGRRRCGKRTLNKRYNEQDPAPQYDPETARIRRALRAQKARRRKKMRSRRLFLLGMALILLFVLVPNLWGQGRTAFIPPQVRSAGGPVGGDLRP